MSDLDGLLDDLAPGEAGLAIDADLRVELTTAAGASTMVRVTGHGQQVRVEAQRPEVLLAVVDREDVGRIADLLAATGVTVDVSGPRGPVATLGAGTSNRLGRVVTGSRHVAPAPRGALRLAGATRSVLWVTAGFAVLGVGLAVVRSVGRSRP